MNKKIESLFTAAVLLVLAPSIGAAQSYHIAQAFKLGGAGTWDYLALDGATNRLYIGRTDRIMVVDPAEGKLLGEVPGLERAHGVAFDDASGRGFATSGGDETVVVFDLQTLKTLGRTKVDEDDDAILLDPATGRIFTFNGDAHTASALEPSSGKLIGTVELGAKPEFGVADGRGRLYVNLESSSEIAELDSASLTVTRRWSLAPCEAPTGLAIDAAHHVLFSVCRNQLMVMSDAGGGHVVAQVAIGPGADAARFDAETGLAFASTGGDGAITAVHEDSPTAFRVVQTVKTQAGARTMELDPKTHRLYTVSAELKPPPQGSQGQRRRPEIVPGSFTLFVLEP
jgi:DNA-binding beta-propeller fold protein YncE